METTAETDALTALEQSRQYGNPAIDTWALQGTDDWGDTMAVLFALAETIRAASGEVMYEYTPAPAYLSDPDMPGEYGEDWITTDLWDMYDAGHLTIVQMREAYNLLMTYRDALEAAGKSY